LERQELSYKSSAAATSVINKILQTAIVLVKDGLVAFTFASFQIENIITY
jgi:hypothetical protein